MEKLLWENYKVVGEVMKSERLKFVVAAAAKDGYRCVSIREFYLKKTTGEWKPGKDGITLYLNMPENISKVRDGSEQIKLANSAEGIIGIIAEAVAHASTMELSDKDHQVWYTVKEK